MIRVLFGKSSDFNILTGFLSTISLSVSLVHHSTFLSDFRYMFGVAAIPSIIQFVAFMFMPESPRWLIIKERPNEARTVLRRLRGEYSNIDEEYECIRTSILSVIDEAKNRGEFFLLFTLKHT